MADYLGDFKEDSTHYFLWDSNDGDGASITRATDGTVTVWKEGDSTSASTTGVTDAEDEGVTGLHRVSLVLTDAFYATGKDYTVVLLGAVIDGQTVNAVLAEFSIENRETKLRGLAAASAGKLDDMLDGTGGTGLWLNAITISGAATGISVTGTTAAVSLTGGTTGIGLDINGGSSSGNAVTIDSNNGSGIYVVGTSYGLGIESSGSSGVLFKSTGGAGHALELEANGSGAGIYATGGATGDGMTLIGQGGAYDLNADIQGAVSGAVGSIGASGIVAATFGAGAINAAAIANAAIDNATFAADVGSTAYATNIIALAVRKALDEIKLDHLLAVADADDVVDNAALAKLASTDGDWSKFVDTTDSLQSIRDALVAGIVRVLADDGGKLKRRKDA